jgi:hypothetical protein
MIKSVVGLAGVWLLAAGAPAPAPPQASPERLLVFCGSVSKDGFENPDVRDSVRDLRDALGGKKKTLRLVEAPEAADVQVMVEGREEIGDAHTVYVRLVVGGLEESLRGSDDWFWTRAADDLAGQVDRWLKLNRGRLLARRGERRAAAPR